MMRNVTFTCKTVNNTPESKNKIMQVEFTLSLLPKKLLLFDPVSFFHDHDWNMHQTSGLRISVCSPRSTADSIWGEKHAEPPLEMCLHIVNVKNSNGMMQQLIISSSAFPLEWVLSSNMSDWIIPMLYTHKNTFARRSRIFAKLWLSAMLIWTRTLV